MGVPDQTALVRSKYLAERIPLNVCFVSTADIARTSVRYSDSPCLLLVAYEPTASLPAESYEGF